MKHKIPSSRWELMMIISSIFLTLNTVVFGGEKKKFIQSIQYLCLIICYSDKLSALYSYIINIKLVIDTRKIVKQI